MKVEKAIIKTLLYHDLFEYPLKELEIWRYLISPDGLQPMLDPELRILRGRENHQFQTILEKLIKKKKIERKEEYYFLQGKAEIVEKRLEREKYSKKKMRIAKRVAGVLGKIPFVKMIGVTGALAMDNSEENDDIDFLIIASKNRLWTTRFLCVGALEAMCVRRRPKGRDINNKICLNMFLDEGLMEIKEKNLYTAHEVVQMRPVVNKNKTYERFMGENEWVREFLPNTPNFQYPISNFQQNSQLPITQLLNYLEKFVFIIQKLYMKPKVTREQISPHFAFFHPKDRGKEIMEKLLN